MKYHNFSEALRGSGTIKSDNDLIVIVVPEKGNATYLVSSVNKVDDTEITIVAYSVKFMSTRNMSVSPITYKDLTEFENSKINNPQSFIPLGSTFDKDLPNVRIYLDSEEVKGDYRCVSAKFMSCAGKQLIPVKLCRSNNTPYNIGYTMNLPVDLEIMNMQMELKHIINENQPDDNTDNANYATGVKPSKKLTKVEIVLYTLQTTCSGIASPLSECRVLECTETYDVEDVEFGEGLVGLTFPDGKVKAIPINRIKEVNIEKKKEI